MVSPSRLRVSRALKDDERDVIPVADNGIRFTDSSRLGDFWKKTQGPPISQPGDMPRKQATPELKEKGFNPPVQGQDYPSQVIIDETNRGNIDPNTATSILAGTEDAAAREAKGTIERLLWNNANARKNEVDATDILANFAEALSPKLVEDFTVPNSLQNYRKAIRNFSTALASSPIAAGRPPTTEEGQGVAVDQYSVGMNDDPEEIALARGAREQAINSLLGLAPPNWVPGPVTDAMAMIEQNVDPEEVIGFLDSQGIYGPFFRRYWPKDPRYALPREPDGYADPLAGMPILRKDESGRTIRGVDMGPVQ